MLHDTAHYHVATKSAKFVKMELRINANPPNSSYMRSCERNRKREGETGRERERERERQAERERETVFVTMRPNLRKYVGKLSVMN